ncbi:hypothetical protein AZ78_5329 [Lysobacter capsici AZ78]|uniref:Uncharacterized protein n=1 Tax=Lysobacter capsici AZ78 TaxID=1444315 RepID=A0A125TZW2_9GAMM|nr:hypothetical protein AZ78_5329 [Lysobacter capsici AZ78]
MCGRAGNDAAAAMVSGEYCARMARLNAVCVTSADACARRLTRMRARSGSIRDAGRQGGADAGSRATHRHPQPVRFAAVATFPVRRPCGDSPGNAAATATRYDRAWPCRANARRPSPHRTRVLNGVNA